MNDARELSDILREHPTLWPLAYSNVDFLDPMKLAAGDEESIRRFEEFMAFHRDPNYEPNYEPICVATTGRIAAEHRV